MLSEAARGQSPAVRAETFVVLRIADAISTVHKRQVAHFVKVAGTIFIFQVCRIQSEERIMCPEEWPGFTTLIAQMKFDAFYFMGIDDGTVLCPTVMIDSGRHSVRR